MRVCACVCLRACVCDTQTHAPNQEHTHAHTNPSTNAFTQTRTHIHTRVRACVHVCVSVSVCSSVSLSTHVCCNSSRSQTDVIACMYLGQVTGRPCSLAIRALAFANAMGCVLCLFKLASHNAALPIALPSNAMACACR